MSCSAFSTQNQNVSTSFDGFNDTLVATLADIYCAGDADGHCLGICPNADLAGIGVRTAFYAQSAMNTLLIALSHEESAQGAWTATILTAAIAIPAMIQKVAQQLTLYHATLVLNFATFSTVASLAVAPLCWMWNTKAIAKRALKKQREADLPPPSGEAEALAERVAEEQSQNARIVLSVALIVQIALQWTWAIMLFTTPSYSQTACSGGTTVVLFGAAFTAHEINTTPGYIAIWGMWVAFCMLVTFGYGAYLVFHSAQSKREKEPGNIAKWTHRIIAFFLCLGLLICSERQVNNNCVLGGENLDWGFGQVTALLLAASPIWGIVVALHRHYVQWKRSKNGRPGLISREVTGNSFEEQPLIDEDGNINDGGSHSRSPSSATSLLPITPPSGVRRDYFDSGSPARPEFVQGSSGGSPQNHTSSPTPMRTRLPDEQLTLQRWGTRSGSDSLQLEGVGTGPLRIQITPPSRPDTPWAESGGDRSLNSR